MKLNFTRVEDVHRYSTRFAAFNFHVSRVQGVGTKTFFYSGIKEWNSLPVSIRNVNNYQSFKFKVKQHLKEKLKLDEQNVFLY